MKNINIDDYIDKLYKNQILDIDNDLKIKTTKRDYYHLVKEVLLTIKDNKQKNIQELRNILYKNSNIEYYLKDFFLDKKMAPGCVLSYGTNYYQEIITIGNKSEIELKNNKLIPDVKPMTEDTIFDLASITKLFTTLCILILIQNNKLNFTDKLSKVAPQFKYLKDVSIIELLSFEPIQIDKKIDKASNINEALDILLNAKRKTIYQNEYIYNDYCFMILKYVIENITGESFKFFLEKNILNKLKMNNTFVNIPTHLLYKVANSNYDYRIDENNKCYIRTKANLGISTDEKAQIFNQQLGNLSGHAGLFSNIHDLIILIRALINNKIINKELLFKMSYNQRGYKMMTKDKKMDYFNYYGLGVYIKNPNPNKSEVSNIVSGKSFATAGWTGTQITVDPINKLNCILLSNRSHNRITVIDKKVLNQMNNKNVIVLNNNIKIINSSRYAWDRTDIINNALSLAMKYKILEDLLNYNGNFSSKSIIIK